MTEKGKYEMRTLKFVFDSIHLSKVGRDKS